VYARNDVSAKIIKFQDVGQVIIRIIGDESRNSRRRRSDKAEKEGREKREK
jgi:hypothetical protein